MSIFADFRKKFFATIRFESNNAIPYTWFSKPEVATLHTALGEKSDTIDDQTWRDVGLDQYMDKFAANMSIFGRQLLYRLLRQGRDASDIPDNLKYFLQQDTAISGSKLELDAILDKLKQVDTDIASLLFTEKSPEIPAWLNYIWAYWVLLGLMLVLFFSGYFISFLTVFAIAGIFNALVQIRYFKILEKWKKQERAIQFMVDVALRLANFHGTEQSRILDEIKAILDTIVLTRQKLSNNFMMTVPGMEEYANAGFLYEYLTLDSKIQRILKLLQGLRCIYLAVSRVEVASNLVNHLKSEKFFALAQIAKPMELELRSLRSPFIEDGDSLDVKVSGSGLLLTGQNGVGKSTLLRTIGINLVIGRALGFCYATSASIPRGPVATGIQLEDSLADGNSKYMVELARASQLLHLCQNHSESVLIIDEIFQGTNHHESVSAATAVLTKMSRTAIVFASTHNLILAPLLDGELTPYYLSRQVDANMKLELRPGILGTTNGISMMADYGFSKEIIEDAININSRIEKYMIDKLSFETITLKSSSSTYPA